MFTAILYGVAGTGLILSFFKDRTKTKMALKKAWKSFENILPQFLSVLVIIGLALAILTPEQISRFLGSDSGLFGILVALLIGGITLIPGFVAFPLAAAESVKHKKSARSFRPQATLKRRIFFYFVWVKIKFPSQAQTAARPAPLRLHLAVVSPWRLSARGR